MLSKGYGGSAAVLQKEHMSPGRLRVTEGVLFGICKNRGWRVEVVAVECRVIDGLTQLGSKVKSPCQVLR